jgi:hypothetical protein
VAPHTLESLFDIGWCGMLRIVGMFRLPAVLYYSIYFVLMARVKGDCALNLIQAQGRKVSLNRSGIFPFPIL